MFQLVWCVLCTLYHLSRYDVLDSYPPISHVPIPALCAASKVLVIKSCAGSFYKTKSEPVGLFRVHESLVLLIAILSGT